MKHVVMFSSGAGSWVADKYGTDNLYLVFADVKGDNDLEHTGEDTDNYRFLREAAADVGGELVWLKDGRDIWQVFHDDRFLGNSQLANCSKFLKQVPARNWLNSNCVPEDTTVYVGIDWTESHRLKGVNKGYAPFRVEAPMCEKPYLDKDVVLEMLRDRGIEPPRLYELGFSHANCGGFCVRSGMAAFKHLLQVFPERYDYHEKKEQELREYLGKNVSIIRSRAGGKVTPVTLREFRQGVQGDDFEVDPFDVGGCGCFVADE